MCEHVLLALNVSTEVPFMDIPPLNQCPLSERMKHKLRKLETECVQKWIAL